MSDFDMPLDPEQADLLVAMQDEGLITAKSLAYDGETGERTAYRIINGDSPLTVKQMRAVVRSNDKIGERAVGDKLLRYACRGTERAVFDLSYGQIGDVQGDAVELLRKLANLLEARKEHEADGVITTEESEEEVNLWDDILAVAQRGRKACIEQPTSIRHKAHPLKLNGGAS